MNSRQLSEQKDKGYGKGQQKKEEIMCTIGRISGGTERKVHYGTERKKRIAAPSGAVILSERYVLADIPIGTVHGRY